MPATVAKFTPGQPVTLVFRRGMADEYRTPATVLQNIDHVCSPLTDMWQVRSEEFGSFGFSGQAIEPR